MDKKSLFIIIPIVLVVLFYWQILEFLGLYKPAVKPIPQGNKDSVHTLDTTHLRDTLSSAVGSSASRPAELSLKQAAPDSSAPLSPVTDSSAHRVDSIHVLTRQYEIVCVNRGGGPVSIRLRNYTRVDSSHIDLLAGGTHALPELRFATGSVSTDALWFSTAASGTLDATSSPVSLSYTYTPPGGGAKIIKRFTFRPESYSIGCTVEFENAAALGFERSYRVYWPNPLPVTETPKIDHDAMEVVAFQQGNRVGLAEFADNKLNQSVSGDTRWCGVRSKYFAGVIMATTENVGTAALGEGTVHEVSTSAGRIKEKQLIGGLEMELIPGERHRDSLEIFAGPLDYTLLDHYPDDLETLLNIGTTPWVGWIIKPFALGVIWLLPRMHALIPNYGICIILFALLVKLLTLPLSLKTFKSMAAMREIGPKLEKLKAKYKDNPQALTAETMSLYKEAGVNPFSGCLPMLAQMPIFFGLFSVFRSSILLRHAPFVGFINDLSHGAAGFTDPYIILVVLMIGAQFLSSYITTSNQPQQNKIFMYLFPVMMGFMFYSFAAGLVLYWTCFSVFSLIDFLVFRRNRPKNTHVQTA